MVSPVNSPLTGTQADPHHASPSYTSLTRANPTQNLLNKMPAPTPERTRSFPTPKHFAKWLADYHATESELWIKIHKKASGLETITWNEAVIEALRWGWIDGIKKSLNQDSYLQRFTPRRKGSNWSKRNREHVEKMIREDRMHEPGLMHVRAAKADGRWEAAYAASEMQVPEDFIAAVDACQHASQTFAKLNKSNRYVIGHQLTSAKKPETRQRRFTKLLNMLKQGEKPG
ncbi:Uncharacterized conserved protein YdeI, YjbR/CyaY-like superfamily, DUF1801 family [Neorhodopirellula lusitana]|uniref:Uncharacterized conserved protein YdeI, YjbR/CyaY-like superfamily, DUF1801 family n=1 Tax=Neorhodopirellula lusitana TaxID=445327 RepID=A0ABY1QBG9_9BACT|nr:YdeI/OmpD-associated family protein [Neorhodopirellula lusitana]SMP61869.1 Uncharacterized conserved protein YdeI, YjbR/CyaY-like superfamily, DUF1801 family [Neorhodopirellula lusitana]